MRIRNRLYTKGKKRQWKIKNACWICPGAKGIIVRIRNTSPSKNRLLEMGGQRRNHSKAKFRRRWLTPPNTLSRLSRQSA